MVASPLPCRRHLALCWVVWCVMCLGCSSDSSGTPWQVDGGGVVDGDTDALDAPTDGELAPDTRVPDGADTDSAADTSIASDGDTEDGRSGDARPDGGETAQDGGPGGEEGASCTTTQDCDGDLVCADASADGDDRACATPTDRCDCGDTQWCTETGECVSGDWCDESGDCDGSCLTGNYCGGNCQATADCLPDEECFVEHGEDEAFCAPAVCRCRDRRDICYRHNGCIRPEINCVFDSCPDGYHCETGRDAAVCRCSKSVPFCQATCSDDSDCEATGFGCSANNYCEPSFCQDDGDCQAGEACTRVPGGWGCKPAGNKAPREACSHPSECASGTCIGSSCVEVCRSNADCPGHEECVWDRSLSYCRSAVCGQCSNDEFCRDGACRKPCWGRGDCPTGETCHFTAPFPICLPVECVEATADATQPVTCASDEICDNLIEPNGCTTYCLTGSECQERADCDDSCSSYPEAAGELCSNYRCK